MLYQLPTGRTVELTVEQYLDMTDDDLQYLIAYNYGDEVEDPWFGSVLTESSPAFYPLSDLPDLTQLSDSERFIASDLDFSRDTD